MSNPAPAGLALPSPSVEGAPSVVPRSMQGELLDRCKLVEYATYFGSAEMFFAAPAKALTWTAVSASVLPRW